MSNDELTNLIDRARRVVMTDAEREAQRRSFAYGNIKIENDMVTRDMVEEEAAKLVTSDRD
jgi:hypothetical protein